MSELNLYVFLTMLSWGLWGIFDKKALAFVKQHDVMLRLWILAIIWVPVSYIFMTSQVPDWKLNQDIVLWTGFASVANTVALFAYLAAMSKCEASYVLGMTSAYPLVFQFLAALVLKEALVPERLLGASVIAGGLFLISGSSEKKSGEKGKAEAQAADSGIQKEAGIQAEAAAEAELESKKTVSPMSLLFIFIATLSWGIYGLFDKLAVACGVPALIFFSKTCWDFLFLFPLLIGYRIARVKIDWTNKAAWGLCAVSELALGIGGLSYLAALSLASASYVITITGCYPLIMYIFAICLLKEKFNKLRFLGICLIVAGGILVQRTEGL